jgi:hypothetical protein
MDTIPSQIDKDVDIISFCSKYCKSADTGELARVAEF